MKKLFLLLILLMILQIIFSASTPLIKYYDNTVMSHACFPGDQICVYTNSVNVDSKYISNLIDGIKVIGVSNLTNAHVEINNGSTYTNNNYSKDIIMVNDIFSNNLCEFTNKGDSCSIGKTCGFAVSDEKNAHISKCDTFLSEIKFCCTTEVFSGVDQTDGIPSNCNIHYFEISNKTIDNNVLISYSCKESVDANILIYSSKGDILSGPNNVSCDLDVKNFDSFSISESQVLGFKLYTDDCDVEKFVNISKSQDVTIPDNNLFLVFVLLGLVVFLIKRKD